MNRELIKNDIQSAIERLTRAKDFLSSNHKRAFQNFLVAKATCDAIEEEFFALIKELDPPGEPSPTP